MAPVAVDMTAPSTKALETLLVTCPMMTPVPEVLVRYMPLAVPATRLLLG